MNRSVEHRQEIRSESPSLWVSRTQVALFKHSSEEALCCIFSLLRRLATSSCIRVQRIPVSLAKFFQRLARIGRWLLPRRSIWWIGILVVRNRTFLLSCRWRRSFQSRPRTASLHTPLLLYHLGSTNHHAANWHTVCIEYVNKLSVFLVDVSTMLVNFY